MNPVRPLAEAPDRLATAEQRDFGFQESWLREMERARADLLGRPSSPGERTSPQADAPRPQDPDDSLVANPATTATPLLSTAPLALPSREVAQQGVWSVAQGMQASAAAIADSFPVAGALDVQTAAPGRAPVVEFATNAPLHPVETFAITAPLVSGAGVPARSLPTGQHAASAPVTREVSTAFMKTPGDSRVSPAQAGALPIEKTSAMPSQSIEATKSAAMNLAESKVSLAPSSIQGPVTTSTVMTLEFVVPITAIGGAIVSGLEPPTSRTQPKVPSPPASAAPERADPPPRRRIHVHAEGSEASVWLRDADLDPARSQGLLARIAAQIALAGRRLKSFSVNGRVILGSSRSAASDLDASDNPVQQAKR